MIESLERRRCESVGPSSGVTLAGNRETSTFEIDRRPESLSAASRDFGHLVSGRAEGITSPRDVEELVAIVRHANEHGIGLTPCGVRGSCGGQSLPNGGWSLDLTRMSDVGDVDVQRRTIACGPGATLRSVAEATLRHGFLPNILSFNLDLTVGGVLSAAGFGANCHRFGPVISNVPSLEVVTGGGLRLQCSRDRDPELFHAVLGGQGRCGVISRATLALRAIQPKVRLWSLVFHDQTAWLDAQQALIRNERCDHLQAFLWAGPQLLRATSNGFAPKQQWSYGLSVGSEYTNSPPADEHVVGGLNAAAVLARDDAEAAQFIDLYRDRFEQMRRTRAWERRHPWIDCLLTPDMLREALPKVLEMLPRGAGDGHRLAWIPTANLPKLFSVPAGEWAVILAVLPTSIDDSVYEETVASLDEVRRYLWGIGGKAYLANWFGPMDEAGWRRHFGARFDAWMAAKNKYDPRGVLRSVAFGG